MSRLNTSAKHIQVHVVAGMLSLHGQALKRRLTRSAVLCYTGCGLCKSGCGQHKFHQINVFSPIKKSCMKPWQPLAESYSFQIQWTVVRAGLSPSQESEIQTLQSWWQFSIEELPMNTKHTYTRPNNIHKDTGPTLQSLPSSSILNNTTCFIVALALSTSTL